MSKITPFYNNKLKHILEEAGNQTTGTALYYGEKRDFRMGVYIGIDLDDEDANQLVLVVADSDSNEEVDATYSYILQDGEEDSYVGHEHTGFVHDFKIPVPASLGQILNAVEDYFSTFSEA